MPLAFTTRRRFSLKSGYREAGDNPFQTNQQLNQWVTEPESYSKCWSWKNSEKKCGNIGIITYHIPHITSHIYYTCCVCLTILTLLLTHPVPDIWGYSTFYPLYLKILYCIQYYPSLLFKRFYVFERRPHLFPWNSKYSNTVKCYNFLQKVVYCNILKCNFIPVVQTEFSASLLQSSVLHDSSEIILICCCWLYLPLCTSVGQPFKPNWTH